MSRHLRRALAFAVVAGLAGGCARSSGRRPSIVASTTLISTIVEAVAPGRFAVTTIAPAGLCPGHFDLKPSDVAAANNARLILNHGWETWYASLEKAIVPPGPRRVTLSTQGNWMIPELQKQAAVEIAALLAEVDTPLADTYRLAVARYQSEVDSVAAAVRAMLAGKELPPVIASEQQAPFLKWLGFQVVATYGRAEDFTAQELTRLARVASGSGVKLVVDNLQSGPDTGEPLADGLGAKHVTLTNFPLEGSYPKALLDNAAALAQALGQGTKG